MISFSYITTILIALSTGCSRADFTGLVPGQSSKTNSNNTPDGGQSPSSKTNSVTTGAAGLAPINPQSCSVKRFRDTVPEAREIQCPAESAVYGGLSRNSGSGPSVICCPLPASDILTGDIARRSGWGCESNEVVIGISVDKAIICGRVNTDRYKLDAPLPVCSYHSNGTVSAVGDPNRCQISSETAKALVTKARDGGLPSLTCLPSQSSGLMRGFLHEYDYCNHSYASVLRFSDSGQAVQMFK